MAKCRPDRGRRGLLYLAIAQNIEPLLLVPIGFGVILGNLPLSGMSASDEGGVVNILYNAGILTEVFPALIFLGLGAMIDFGPMLANPKVLIFGAAGQFGIFLTLLLALGLGSASFAMARLRHRPSPSSAPWMVLRPSS